MKEEVEEVEVDEAGVTLKYRDGQEKSRNQEGAVG